MSIVSQFGFESNDPKLEAFHQTRYNPRKAICIKDNPKGTTIDHHVFKKGDIVTVKGTTGRADGTFELCIPEVCGFYDYTYFELIE